MSRLVVTTSSTAKPDDDDGSQTRIPTVVLTDSRISFGARILYCTLASYDWAGKGLAWPSRDLLAARLNITTRQVQRLMTELVTVGLVRRERRERRSRTGASRLVYHLVPTAHLHAALSSDLAPAPSESRSSRRSQTVSPLAATAAATAEQTARTSASTKGDPAPVIQDRRITDRAYRLYRALDMRDAGGLVRGVTVLDLCRELSWNGAKFRRALHELLAAGVVKSTYTPGLGRTYRLLGGTS